VLAPSFHERDPGSQRLFAIAGAISITLAALAAELAVPVAPEPAMLTTTATTTISAAGIDAHHQLGFGAIRWARGELRITRQWVGVYVEGTIGAGIGRPSCRRVVGARLSSEEVAGLAERAVSAGGSGSTTALGRG
jgi:hypothetical protein